MREIKFRAWDMVEGMGTIVFDEEWASFANQNEAGNTLLREINDIEVLGNIYENIDLINKEEKS